MTHRRTIPMLDAEDSVLRSLYRSFRIPVGQYNRRRRALRRLTSLFNTATGRSVVAEDLLHYMITRRKQGRWETLNGDHKRLAPVLDDLLAPEEWLVLDEVYVQIGIGADTYFFDHEAAHEFASELSRRLERPFETHALAAAIVERRKSGSLPKLEPAAEHGFDDIDQVAS